MSDERSPLEKHLQTGIGIIVVGLGSWVGISVSNMQQDVARMQVQIVYLTEKISDIKTGISNRYTSSDAARDKESRDKSHMDFRRILIDHDARLRKLEGNR